MASAERAGSVPRGNHGSGEASSGIAELRRSGNELEHSAPVPLSTTRTQEAAAAPAPPPPPPTDEGPSPFVQEGVQRKLLKAATVQQLDGTKQTFYVHVMRLTHSQSAISMDYVEGFQKKADGEILFDMVAAQLELIEKDYFGLVFADSDQATGAASAHHWLYKDKKIERQLKGRPWCFAFVLKFYPPDPEKLGEDIAHDLMYLQLKNDVQDRRLPITLPIEAKLAALAAQAEFGDYPGRTGEQYKSYLRQANIAQPMTESLIEKIAELHTQHKGLTPQEAKLAYLSECKDIAMYGIWQFPTKERSVNVGVNYHGLHVHSDQMRVHRFAWPSINRFSYRGNTFSIRLNAGELNEKKEKTVSYKMPDYHTAARLFNLAVEHHTFFRLIQPEARDKKGLFKLCTSNRFRYQGRTNIQSHMASQLFDQSSQHVDGNRSNVLGSKSADDIQRHAVSALHHADDGMRTPPENPIGPPLATSTVKKKKRGDDGDGGDEVGGPVYHSYRLQRHNQQHARHTQLSNVTTSAATPPSSSPTTPVTTAAVAASFTASNNAQQKQQHGELVEDYLDLSSTSGSTHPALLPSDTSTSTAVDYNTTTAVSDDGSVIIRTTTTKRIVTTTASTAHDHPFVTSHTEALAERQAQHRFTSASLISNTLSSTSSNTSFTSALDDTLVLLNDSGYEPSVSVGGALGGGGGSLRPDAAQSPTSSKYTSRVTSPSYVLNSSFDESRVSPYEGERFSVATTSLPYSSGGAQQKVRFATAAGERSRSPFKGLFARERGKSPAPKDSSLRPLSTSSPLGLDVTWRHSEVPLVPIGDRVQLYNSGVYTSLPPGVEDVNQLGETHTFTLLPGLRRRRRKKRIPTAEKILRQSRTFDGTMGYLTPRAEVEHIPLRYCVACYHSGFSHRPWIRRRAAAGGREEVTSWLNKENYTFPTVLCLEHSRLEKDPELETAALRAYTSPYHVPYYDRKGLPPQPLRVQRVDGRPETVAILHLRREPEPVERAVIVKEESEGKLPLEPPPSEQSRKKIRVSVRERLRAKSAQKPSEDEPSAPAALFKSDDMKEKPIGEAVTVHHTSSRESPSKRGSTEKTSPTKERLALLRPKSGEKKETEEISNAPSKGTTRDTSATTTSEAPTKKRVMKAGYPSYSDLYTGELHELSRAKHDLNDLPIEEHVAATAKPTIVRVEWEPEKSPGVEATKDEGKGTGILRMRTSVPREDIGEAIAVVGPYEPQRPKSIATLHLRRPQSVEDEGAKKIGSPGADNLEEGWKAEEVGSTSGVKPAALLHLRKQQPTKTTEHDVREERGSVYSYPVRSDPYTGEVASLRHHADPAKESIEQYVSIYRVAVYPARKRSNRAHRASTAAQGSEPPAEISKPPAPASHSVLRPTVLLHLKHSPELPPSETASSQPAAVRVEAVRRKPRAGKTYWMGGRLGSALRGRRRDDAALATPITQDESVPTTTSTAPPKPPRSMKSRARPKAVLHLKKHHVQSEEGPDAVRPTAAAVPTTHIVNTQPYSGPLQAANRSGELAPLPISQHSCVYHSGWSVQRRSVIERLSTVVVSHRRERKKSGSDEPPTPPPTPSEPPIDSAKSIALLHLREGGVVETPVEKRDSAEAGRISKVARSPPPTNATYRILTDPYTGDLETLGRKKEVESESIANFISPLPSLRWTADTKEGTSRVEAGSDGSEERQKAILHLVKRGDSPFEEPPAVLPIAAKRSRRSGEKGKKTTTGKKSPPTAHYPFDAEPFDGSLLALGREQDIEAEPISTHVLKTDAPSIKKNEVAEGVVDAEAGPGGEKKPRATLHLRPSTTSSDKAKHQRAGRETEVLPPAPTEIAEVGGKVLKKERAIVVRKGASKLGKRYALSASIFTGRLHSLSRGGELEADSIESHISSPPLNAEQQPVTVVKGPMAVATLYLKSSPPAAGAPEMVTAVDGGTTTLVGKESPAIPPSRYPPPTEPFIGVLQSLGRREEAAAELISIHVTSPPVNMASSAWRKKPTASLHLIKPTSPAPADETGEALPPKQNVPRIIIDRSSLKRKALTTPAPSAAPTTAFPIYEMNTAPYTGPLETIHPAQLMEHEPLTSIVKVYHTGYSVQQKGRASLTDNEGNRGSKKGAIIYLREESAEPADAISAPPTRVSKTRDRIFKTPKRGKGTRDEVEEWLEPGQYTPYAFEKRAYEGYLHTLSQVGELEPHSLSEHVALYHPGTSFTASDAGRKWMGVVLKSRPEAYAAVRGDGGKPRRHTAEREEWRGIGGGRDGAKPREHKATAVLHLKRHSPTEHHPMPISDNSQLTTTSTIAGLAAREEKATTYSTTVFIWRKRGHQKQSPVISTNRYEGPMASMGPQRHLDSASTASPLRDYVHVYNPGTSYSFTAASRPPSTTAAIPDRRPLAFLHLKSAAPSGGSGDYENEAIGVDRNQALSPISVDSEGAKSEKSTALLHLRALSPSSGGDKENRPAAAVVSTKRNHSHSPYQPSTDPGMLSIYEGPLASLQRNVDNALEETPLEAYVKVYHPSGIMPLTPPKKGTVHKVASQGSKSSTPATSTAYTGPLEALLYAKPMADSDLGERVDIGGGSYHTAHEEVEASPSRQRLAAVLHLKSLPADPRKSASAKHLKLAATDSYPLDIEPYSGPFHALNRALLFHGCPIESSVATYHPGYYSSPTAATKASPLKEADQKEHEEMEVPPSRRSAAVLHLKSLPTAAVTVSKVQSGSSAPKSASAKHLKRAAIDAYPLNTEPYNGPLHTLNRALLFHGCPIESSVATYHPGYYYSSAAEPSPSKKTYHAVHEEIGVLPSQRPAAVLHLKSPPRTIETPASAIKSASAKHLKRTAIDSYPYDIEPYNGPFHTLNRALLFQGCPIDTSVATYHSGYYYSPTMAGSSPLKKRYSTAHDESPSKQRPAALLHLKKSRPAAAETVSKVQPSSIKHPKRAANDAYPLDIESYDGPLHTLTRALLFHGCPIESSVATYHPGYYSPKTVEGSSLRKSSSTKRKSYALLHMKSGGRGQESEEESPLDKIGVGQKVVEEDNEALEGPKIQTVAILRLKKWQSRDDHYHVRGEPYTGPLASIGPARELDFEPIMNQVSEIYYQFPSPPSAATSPTTKKPSSFVSPVKKAGALLHLRQSTEAGKTEIQRTPVGYPHLTDPYVGELHSTSPAGQLIHDPLSNRVCVYHPGDSHSVSTKKTFVVVERRQHDVKSQSPVKKALAAAKLRLKDNGARQAEKGESDEVLNWVVDESSTAIEKKQSPQPSSSTHKPKAILHTHITAISQQGGTQPTPSRVSEPPEESEKTTKTYSSWLWWSREEPTATSLTIKTTPHEGPLSSMQPTGQLPTVPLASTVAVSSKLDEESAAPSDLKPAAIIHMKTKAPLKGGYVPSNSELMMQKSTDGDGVGSMAPDAELSKEPIEIHVSVYGPKPYALAQAERAGKAGKAAATLHLKKRRESASTEEEPKPVPQPRDEADSKRSALMAVLHLKDLKIDEGGTTTTSEAPIKKRVVKVGYPSHSDLYTGELHELSRAKHDLSDLPIEEHVAATAKPTIVRVEWEPEKSPGVEATKDEGKGMGILHMRTSVPREDIGEAIAVVGPYGPQRPKSIATLHLRRPQSAEDEGAKKICSPGADNLEEGWKAEKVGSTSEVKPAALLHLRKQQPTKTTEHDVREERGSVYSYPVRSDPYTGEVASLHYRADPSKEPIEQCVSIYRVAVYPARRWSKHRAHRASTAAQGSEPPAEISKLPAPAFYSLSKPTVLLHLKHSPELPPSEIASSQPAAVRVEAVRRKPRAGKTYWIGGRLAYALRGRRRLATPIAQVTRLEQMESTIRTSRVEMNLLHKPYVNEAEMGVELRREARIDYTCEAFLVRRTHRFQPPALQSLNDDGAYDGPAFLPKSLFEQSSSGGPSTSTAGAGLTFIIRQPGCQSAREQQKEAGGDNLTTTGISSCGTKEKEGEGGDKSDKSAKRGARKKRRKQKSAAAAGENRESLSAHSPPGDLGEGTAARLTSTAAGGIAISSTSVVGSQQSWPQSSPPPSTSAPTEMKDHGTGISIDNQQPQQSSSSAAASGPSIFSAIRRRLSQTMGVGLSKSGKKRAEKEAKRVEKQLKKEEKSRKKEKAKKAKKIGVDVSSSTSSSSSSSDVEVHHVVATSQQQSTTGGDAQPSGPPPKPARAAEMQKSAQQQTNIATASSSDSTVTVQSAGPYTPARDPSDGRVVREERLEQVYRIVGNGSAQVPRVDPHDARCLRESDRAPKVNMVVEDMVVTEKGPVPQTIKEVSLPHTTTHTWHESMTGPETVTTEVDEHGNIIRRTVLKSEQVRHTVQTQSYQTFRVDENTAPMMETPPANGQDAVHSMHTHTAAYENSTPRDSAETASKATDNAVGDSSSLGELVSSKAVTTGNRTVETLTYKKDKDGVVETHVEHRITIHSGDDIDHDEELSRAILEATNMNPNLNVEKVDFKRDG